MLIVGPPEYDYDIAMIRIKAKPDGRGIIWGPTASPACLPDPDLPTDDLKQCHVSGWGKLANFRFPKQLQVKTH